MTKVAFVAILAATVKEKTASFDNDSAWFSPFSGVSFGHGVNAIAFLPFRFLPQVVAVGEVVNFLF